MGRGPGVQRPRLQCPPTSDGLLAKYTLHAGACRSAVVGPATFAPAVGGTIHRPVVLFGTALGFLAVAGNHHRAPASDAWQVIFDQLQSKSGHHWSRAVSV